MTDKEYQKLVQRLAPKSPFWKDCANAFWIGGLICCIGQFFLNWYQDLGLDKDAAGTACAFAGNP